LESGPPGPPEERSARERRHRRLWFWIPAAMVTLLVLGVIAAVTALTLLFKSGDPELSSQIITLLNQAVGTDSTRFVTDGVRGTLTKGAIVKNPRLLVRTPGGEFTWARARSLRVDYDLAALVLGRPQIFRIELDDPRVDLVHDKNGELVLPRFASHGKGKPSKQETTIEIVVRNGTLTVDREGIRFGRIGGNATLVTGGEASSIFIRDLSGSSETPGRPGRLDLNGRVLIAANSLRAAPLEIALGSSRITAHLDWDLAHASARAGRLTLHPLQVQEALRSLEIQSQEGTVRGDVVFSGTPTAGQARANLTGAYGGEPIDTLVLEARSRPGAIRFDAIRLRVRKSEVGGTGTLFTRGVLVADLAFHDVNPAVIPWLKSPEHTPSGNLAGQVRIEGQRGSQHPSGRVELALASSHLGNLDIDRAFFKGRFRPDGAAAIDSGWIAVPGAKLVGHGTLGAKRAIDARVTVTLEDLTRLNRLLGPMRAASGTGRFTGYVSGTLDSARFDARGELQKSRFENGLASDSVVVVAQGVLTPKIDLTAEVGVRGLRADSRPLGNVDAAVAGGETLSVLHYRQALGDTVLTLQGVIHFEKDQTEATVDSLRLAAGTHVIRGKGPVHVIAMQRHVRVDDLLLDLDPGTLSASMDWNPDDDIVDFRGHIADIDLSRVREIQRWRPVSGLANAEVLVTGSIHDPEASLRLEVAQPDVGKVAGDSLVLNADYAPGVLTIARGDWASGTSRLRLSGTVRSHMTAEDWIHAVTSGDHGWASRATLAIRAVSDSFDLSLLAPADTSLRTLEGSARMEATLTGTPAAPEIEVTGSAPRLTYQGVDASIAAADLAYEDRRLRIKRFEAHPSESVSHVEGVIPIDLSLYAPRRLLDTDPISLHVDMPDGNLAILPILFPEVVGACSGRLSATLAVSGTPQHTIVNGTCKVTKGRVRFAGRDEVLEDLTASATIDQERIQVTSATAHQGKRGQFSATGWWRWPTEHESMPNPEDFGPAGDYNFHVLLTDFTTTDGVSYSFAVTGDLTVANTRNPDGAEVPWVTGHAIVSKGEITLDLSKPPEEPGEPLPFMYNVTVRIPGNLFYRNLDAEVEVETETDADLIFKNEGYGDLALGVLDVRGGKYYVLTREFRNLSGTVNFNSPDRIDPEVDIVGETSLPTPTGEPLTVYLALTDRVSRLKVRVYDEGGQHTSSELWKALAYGQFVGGGTITTAGGGTATASENAGGSVAVPISNYLFQNVEHWIGSTGFIDTIDLRGSTGTANSTSTSPISVVGVGKYVTPDIYFKYSRDFSGSAEEQTNLDYRLTRRLLVKGQRIRRAAANSQNLPTEEYNLDLKIRLEY